jgi:hypothetical protein
MDGMGLESRCWLSCWYHKLTCTDLRAISGDEKCHWLTKVGTTGAFRFVAFKDV